jgi:hypothetical protein
MQDTTLDNSYQYQDRQLLGVRMVLTAVDDDGQAGQIPVEEGERPATLQRKDLRLGHADLSSTLYIFGIAKLFIASAKVGCCGMKTPTSMPAVVLGQFVVQALGGMRQEVAVLVNRAALDGQALAPERHGGGFALGPVIAMAMI